MAISNFAESGHKEFDKIKYTYSIDGDWGVYNFVKRQITSARDEVRSLYREAEKNFKFAFVGLLISAAPTLILGIKGILSASTSDAELAAGICSTAVVAIVPGLLAYRSIQRMKQMEAAGNELTTKLQNIEVGLGNEYQYLNGSGYSHGFKSLLVFCINDVATQMENIRSR